MMENILDRIIVSTDDSHFKDFWPTVAKSWNRLFPNKKICLAFVTDRKENDPLIEKFRDFGEVYLFPIQPNIPTPNQAKMCRHILAGKFGNDICMIEDIDTIPLQKEFLERILNQRRKNTVLRVGSEVYRGTSDEGKFPTSNLTAESYLFKELINPNGLGIDDLFKSWCNIKIIDHKESVNNIPDDTGLNGFSDESLMRVLINVFTPDKERVTEIDRNINPRLDWIDRSWWEIDLVKLKNNEYVICNFLRPLKQNFNLCKPILDFIWNKNILIDDIISHNYL